MSDSAEDLEIFRITDSEGNVLAHRLKSGKIDIYVRPEQLLSALSEIPETSETILYLYETIYAAGAKAGAREVLSKWVDAEGLYVTTEDVIEQFKLTEDEVTEGTIYERPKEDVVDD